MSAGATDKAALWKAAAKANRRALRGVIEDFDQLWDITLREKKDVRRAALEEAARADCFVCAQGHTPTNRGDKTPWWHEWTDHVGPQSHRCSAQGVRDLIAKMKEESEQ